MSKNILIDSFGGNTVGALCQDGKLIEYHIEKSNKTQIVGSIYKGIVKNVLDGMQAAFIDIGLNKNGYLFVTDMLVDTSLIEGKTIVPSQLNIKVGDEIMVQVVKDPVGTKGARLTNNITFAGKFLVYAPTLNVNAVSRKIVDEQTRLKLTEFATKLKRPSGGFICRTASEKATYAQLVKESKQLVSLYKDIVKKYNECNPTEQVFCDGDLPMRLMRDVLTDDVDKIYVTSKTIYDNLSALKKLRKDIDKRLVLYRDKVDIFTKFNLTKEVESLVHNKVVLSSGAYFIIDKTEALTVIDVNTGSFVGDTNIEQTAFETNMLATKEIARQVRLRNVSGIIVVDYIDMEQDEHKNAVLEELKQCLSSDRRKCNVLGMTSLGLVEFTRNKKRRSLSQYFNKTCPYCKGEGTIRSNDYILMKIRTSLLDIFSKDYNSAIIDLNVDICEYILQTGTLYNDIKKFYVNKRVYLIPHKTYHQEFFLCRGDNNSVLDLPEKAILLH
jgi:ribonuclease G